LSVASALGEGSTFTMALPLERAAQPATPFPAMPAAPDSLGDAEMPEEPPLSSADTTQPSGRSRQNDQPS
jgi:hypothetical protein